MKNLLLRSGGLSHSAQGFTLVEMLVAMAIVAIVMGSLTTGIFQIMKVSAINVDAETDIRNLDIAGSWIVKDFQAADSTQLNTGVTTIGKNSGNISLKQAVSATNQPLIVYSINSDGNLQRVNGAVTTMIATDISSLVVNWGSATSANTVVISAGLQPNLTTRTFSIGARVVPGNGGSGSGGGSGPAVTGVSPNSGTTAGGTVVTIAGTNFNGATAVKFGSANATSYTVVSATRISATSPAASAGSLDITVTTPVGTSAVNSYDQFIYAAAPAITGISPNIGSTDGGTNVTVSGTNFSGAFALNFGGIAASFSVDSNTQITAISPAASSGTIDVTVMSAVGTSAINSNDQFTYGTVPTVTGISPNAGTTAGGTAVTISGTNFNGATAVNFGSANASSYTVVSAVQMTAVSPAASAGIVDITITTPGGTSLINSNDRFTYGAAPSVTGILPDIGTTAGGTAVTITGTNFGGASAVKFGSANATSYSVISATQITATSPEASAGIVDITVTTAGGTSASSAPDQFTYASGKIFNAISGNWSTASNWSPNVVPVASDNIEIHGACILDASSATVASVSVDSGCSLNFNSNTSLTLTGNWLNNGSVNLTNSGNNLLVAGNFANNGAFSQTQGLLTMNGTTAQAVNGSAAITLNNLTLSGGNIVTLTSGINAAGTVVVGSASTLSVGTAAATVSTITLGSGTGVGNNGNLTFSANSKLIVGTLAKNSNKTCTIDMSSGGTLSITSSITGTGFAWNTTSGTIEYAGAGNQTVSSDPSLYNNLRLSGSGIKTLAGAETINGNLAIGTGSTLATANKALTLKGDFTNSGTFTAGSSALTISGTAMQSIVGFTTTGLISMTKTGGTATFTGFVNGGGLTINGAGGTLDLGTGLTHTFTGTWTRTAGTLDADSSTLILGSSFSGTGGTFIAGTGTVNYNAAAAKNVTAVTYNNLIFSGGGTKSIATGTVITGNLSISSGTKASVGAGLTINVGTLTFGGASQVKGTYGGTGSGATYVNTTYFAATSGKLNVLGP